VHEVIKSTVQVPLVSEYVWLIKVKREKLKETGAVERRKN
jgi:hypothetical protein